MPSANDYKAARADVADLARAQERETAMHVCPLCHGGANGDVSLAVTVSPAGVMFFCHRASCEFKGYINPQGKENEFIRTFNPRPYRRDTAHPERHTYWWHRVYITARGFSEDSPAETFGKARMMIEESNPACLVTECRDFSGRILGHATRERLLDGSRKVSSWRIADKPLYTVYNGFDKGPIWVVEDALSAYCVYLCGGTGLALMGTNMQAGVVADIRAERRPVVVALDPGAERAASAIYEDLQTAGVAVRIQPLLADIKDMQAKEVQKLVKLWSKAFVGGY